MTKQVKLLKKPFLLQLYRKQNPLIAFLTSYLLLFLEILGERQITHSLPAVDFPHLPDAAPPPRSLPRRPPCPLRWLKASRQLYWVVPLPIPLCRDFRVVLVTLFCRDQALGASLWALCLPQYLGPEHFECHIMKFKSLCRRY